MTCLGVLPQHSWAFLRSFLVDICWYTPATCFHFLAYSLNLFPLFGVLPESHFHGMYALDSIPAMEIFQVSKPQKRNRLLEKAKICPLQKLEISQKGQSELREHSLICQQQLLEICWKMYSWLQELVKIWEIYTKVKSVFTNQNNGLDTWDLYILNQHEKCNIYVPVFEISGHPL